MDGKDTAMAADIGRLRRALDVLGSERVRTGLTGDQESTYQELCRAEQRLLDRHVGSARLVDVESPR
jgi:hypothetical protein